jgi:hypothetical protein
LLVPNRRRKNAAKKLENFPWTRRGRRGGVDDPRRVVFNLLWRLGDVAKVRAAKKENQQSPVVEEVIVGVFFKNVFKIFGFQVASWQKPERRHTALVGNRDRLGGSFEKVFHKRRRSTRSGDRVKRKITVFIRNQSGCRTSLDQGPLDFLTCTVASNVERGFPGEVLNQSDVGALLDGGLNHLKGRVADTGRVKGCLATIDSLDGDFFGVGEYALHDWHPFIICALMHQTMKKSRPLADDFFRPGEVCLIRSVDWGKFVE